MGNLGFKGMGTRAEAVGSAIKAARARDRAIDRLVREAQNSLGDVLRDQLVGDNPKVAISSLQNIAAMLGKAYRLSSVSPSQNWPGEAPHLNYRLYEQIGPALGFITAGQGKIRKTGPRSAIAVLERAFEALTSLLNDIADAEASFGAGRQSEGPEDRRR